MFCGHHSGFVRRVGGNEAARGRSKGENGEVKRLGRTGVDGEVLFLEPVLLSEGGGELGCLAVDIVTASLVSDGCDGFACRFTWAERVLVGVDEDGSLRVGQARTFRRLRLRSGRRCSSLHGGLGEVGLGEDRQGGCDAGHAHEGTAGDGGCELERLHLELLWTSKDGFCGGFSSAAANSGG